MRSFSATDPANRKGKTNTWLTPLALIKALGHFDLDPCAYPGHETAQTQICLPSDGLSENWSGRVWLNPPYGTETYAWLEKLKKHGDGIALVFARTCTNWFHSVDADAYAFLKGRIQFLQPDFSKMHTAGTGSVFLAFGERNVRSLHESSLKLLILVAKKPSHLILPGME